MSLYGENPGPNAGKIYRAIKQGFEQTARGERVRPHWGDSALDAESLRQWFRAKLDGMINVKAGLRSDGAARKSRCNCNACTGRCDCGIARKIIDGRERCGYGCHRPYGEKWEQDYENRAYRDSRAARDRVARRIRVYQFETKEARRRLGHLLSERDDF